jgi:hypothetical protein
MSRRAAADIIFMPDVRPYSRLCCAIIPPPTYCARQERLMLFSLPLMLIYVCPRFTITASPAPSNGTAQNTKTIEHI